MLVTQKITHCSECGKELRKLEDFTACRRDHSLNAAREAMGPKKWMEYVDWFNTFMKDKP